jgi:cytochrome c oxidase assembly protein subunit 11
MKLATAARENKGLFFKLVVITVAMFGFGYALVPIYNAICKALGINVLSVSERTTTGLTSGKRAAPSSTQVDTTRTITVEFDTNARGPWSFTSAVSQLKVHPGEMAMVMYTFKNTQGRAMAAQAIPSYAPKQATAHFNKLECFCFQEYTLAAGEEKAWPVVFVIDPKLPKDVTTITLSYTFFEVSGKGLAVKPAPEPKS